VRSRAGQFGICRTRATKLANWFNILTSKIFANSILAATTRHARLRKTRRRSHVGGQHISEVFVRYAVEVTAEDGDGWPDDLRMSDIEAQFVRQACGKCGADVRPDFNWNREASKRDGLSVMSWSRAFHVPIPLPDGHMSICSIMSRFCSASVKFHPPQLYFGISGPISFGYSNLTSTNATTGSGDTSG
jgi:hypothetical protein